MDLVKQELEILEFWKKNKVFEKSVSQRVRGRRFVFYEGPPTANGAPGIHHIEARAFKDLIPRYKTMRGYFVPRKAGWDTHGLPVEIQVEKELMIKTKQEIEADIAGFNAKAKESVWRYKEEWERLTKRMGFWIDLEHPYITYETSYIETLWWIIKEFWKKKLLYEDFKVIPWCPRCQTGLSSHEVGLGYKDVEDTAVYVKFKVRPGQRIGHDFVSDERTYILSWTTTPWTLPGNVGLAVGEKIQYRKIRHINDNKSGTLFIAAERWSAVLHQAMEGWNQVDDAIYTGEDFRNLAYEPLFDVPELQSKKSHRVYPAAFVSAHEGAGVVHTAVMYGEDDYRLGKEVGLPTFHTVDETGHFIVSLGDGLAGLYVKDEITEKKIIHILKTRNLLFAEEKYKHEYPYCWRCDTPLLYYARRAWWVKTTAVKKKLLVNNEKINWVPDHIKHGRFGEFLKDLRDWAFSRERYWGTPLPIWKCLRCSRIEVIASVQELEERAGSLPHDESGEVNLHRPYVDGIVFVCTTEKCNGMMRRTPEVADVWFDSGAMPFAQSHYPFNKKEPLLFPADYICEAVDQTRGWFYTLLATATLLGKQAPYRNVISLGHVLDKYGQKMSKSRGNVVNPWEMIEKYSSDALRWYFYTINGPGDPKRFDEKDITKRPRGFLTALWNSFLLFDMYVEKRLSHIACPTSQDVLDQWIIIRLDNIIFEVTQRLDHYDIVAAARTIEEFVVQDFSQWYLRRSRQRFQRPLSQKAKNEVVKTTAYVLFTLSKLTAPFIPFTAEAIYQGLKKKINLKERSVHLSHWPKQTERRSRLKNTILENMLFIRNSASEALRLRAEAGIKVRQPLGLFRIKHQVVSSKYKKELMSVLADEINVKEITFDPKIDQEIALDTTITPQLREEGIVREFTRALQEIRKKHGLTPNRRVTFHVAGLTEEFLVKWQSRLERETKSRVAAGSARGGKTVLLEGLELTVRLSRR